MSVQLNRRLENERVLLDELREWRKTHQYGPSYRELSAATEISLGTVYNLFKDLKDQGKVTFEEGVARTLRITARKNK